MHTTQICKLSSLYKTKIKMALFKVFEKKLTETDIVHRLSFPTGHLHLLPFEGESRWVEFEVRPFGDEEPVWKFRCIKRDDVYAKPVIAKGWSEVVKEKRLQVDDHLKFYVDTEDGHSPRYSITVERHGTLLMGAVIPNSDGNWHRIV